MARYVFTDSSPVMGLSPDWPEVDFSAIRQGTLILPGPEESGGFAMVHGPNVNPFFQMDDLDVLE